MAELANDSLVRRLLIAADRRCSARRDRLRDLRSDQPDFVLRIRYPLRYEPIVRAHARNYELDPSLLAAVIYTESKFDAHARAPTPARSG